MTTSTITTTLGACAAAFPVLQQLARERLPVKAAYHVARLTRLVTEEARAYHEQRDALIKAHGAERPPTEQERATRGPSPVWEVTPDNIAAFFARVAELDAIPVPIPWGPLSLTMLDGIDISAADLTALFPFLYDAPSQETAA